MNILEYISRGINYITEIIDYMTTTDPVEKERLEKIWGVRPELSEQSKKEISDLF